MIMKKTAKAVFHPEELDEDDVITRGDIDSHASLLTNRRLDMLFQTADNLGFAVWQNVSFDAIRSYHAILNQIYKDVFVVLSEKRIEKIQGYFNKFLDIFAKIVKGEKKYTPALHFALCSFLDLIHAEINASLQEMNYFFRISKTKYKGLVGALQYFKDKGVKFSEL